MKKGAIVLCGGESSRMGAPKATLPFGDEVLLQRVVRLLGKAVDSIVVVAAQGQELPPLGDQISIVRDERPARGPLEGILAGLRCLKDDVDAVFVTACDTPFVAKAFVDYLFEQTADHQIAVPKEDKFYHPLAAVYRVEVLETIEILLKQDQLRPAGLFQIVATRAIPIEEFRKVDPELATLRNLNHPEEYQQALVDAGFS